MFLKILLIQMYKMNNWIKSLFKYKKNKLTVVSIFFIMTIILLKGIIFSDGIMLGGDWSLPGTNLQTKEYTQYWNSTWTNQGNFLGIRQISLTSFSFLSMIRAMHFLEINGEIISKLILIAVFVFSAYSIYLLLRYLKIQYWIAILGGVIYITMPIFFDYTIMGWQFALLAMGLFPLATKYFIQSVKENKIKYSIFTGIIYTLAMMQSQSMVWFPIIFAILGFYLIKNKKSFFIYLKSISVVFSLFIALNMYWALGMIIVPDKMVSGSDIVNSVISLGTMGHFYPLNIIRLFGGLFNFQYESAVNKTPFSFLSFIIPLLALGTLFIKKNRKRNITFWLIALFPLAMYILNFNRDILLHIPFSNVIRDFARFTVLSSFAYTVLASVFLNFLISNKKLFFRKAGYGFILLWFVSIFPWWTGGLTDWENGIGSDMRLRNKIFPKEYLEVEKDFAKKKLDQKALYLPIGGMVSFEDDNRFKGMFKETQDIFAGYSPISGVIGLSDRSHGYVNDFVNVIIGNDGADFIHYLKVTDVGYVILRNNMVLKDREAVIKAIQIALDKKILNEYYSSEKISVYKVNNFIPHIYTTKNIVVSDDKVSGIPKLIHTETKNKVAVFLEKQNSQKLEKLASIRIENYKNANENKLPLIEFKKISPNKYRILLNNAEGKFPLIFSESFHDQWKIYLIKNSRLSDVKNDSNQFISKNFQGTIQNDNLAKGKFYETWFKDSLDEENHLMANGYANSWLIDTKKLCAIENSKCIKNSDGTYDLELIIEFWPQRLFYIGLFISATTLFGCLIYLGYDWNKNKK